MGTIQYKCPHGGLGKDSCQHRMILDENHGMTELEATFKQHYLEAHAEEQDAIDDD